MLKQKLCRLAACAAAAMCCGSSALADVDLVLLPSSSTVTVGEVLEVALYAASNNESAQVLSAAQMIFAWDTVALDLIGHHDEGAVELAFSGFPANDPYGINESVPPANGIGLYQAWAVPGQPVKATSSGTLLTTLEFKALTCSEALLIDILPSAGDPVTHTIVFDGSQPNTPITGELTGATAAVNKSFDLTGDGSVGIGDLLVLIGSWGPCDGCEDCPADLDCDCSVGVPDLILLIDAFD